MGHGTPAAYKGGCRCEVCVTAKREKDRAYYERNRERVKAKVQAYKETNAEAVAATQRRYREANAETIQARKREYHQANAEAIRAKVVAWQRANPEQRREQRRRYRDAHREELRVKMLERYYRLMAEDPERVRKLRRDWAKTRKGVLANRAARTARRGAPYTEESLAWIASLVDPTCWYCGRIATEIDHVIPVSRGGSGERSNLVPSCRSCNASKNAMGLEKFLARLEEQGRWPLTTSLPAEQEA